MKIIFSQKEKKLEMVFEVNGAVDNYRIDKAEDFLTCVDKLLKKCKTPMKERFFRMDMRKNLRLEFHHAGLLTERIINAIILGLCF